MIIELNMLDMGGGEGGSGGLPVDNDILLFGNDDLSVEITTFIFSCVQKYIKDTRRFSWTNKSTCITLLTIVYIVYFYMYVYSFLGRAWGIDWLTCQGSMKYTCVIQFKLYLPMQDPHELIKSHHMNYV